MITQMIEKDKTPLVSVIMPVFNEEQYVRDAIESILEQTYQNLELNIIDDYSTDRSMEICRSFNDQRIHIFRKENEPKGTACARNIGIEVSRGDYIMLQDADDWSCPMRLEKQLAKALENPGRRVVGCSIKQIRNGRQYQIIMPKNHEEIIKGFKRFYNRTTIICGTMLAPRSILQEIPYRSQIVNMEDWDQMLRMYERGKVEFYNCQEQLYIYHIRSKCNIFQANWPASNIYVRHCQAMRKKGLYEFQSLEEFLEQLKLHPLKGMKWLCLKKFLDLKLRITHYKCR